MRRLGPPWHHRDTHCPAPWGWDRLRKVIKKKIVWLQSLPGWRGICDNDGKEVKNRRRKEDVCEERRKEEWWVVRRQWWRGKRGEERRKMRRREYVIPTSCSVLTWPDSQGSVTSHWGQIVISCLVLHQYSAILCWGLYKLQHVYVQKDKIVIKA